MEGPAAVALARTSVSLSSAGCLRKGQGTGSSDKCSTRGRTMQLHSYTHTHTLLQCSSKPCVTQCPPTPPHSYSSQQERGPHTPDPLPQVAASWHQGREPCVNSSGAPPKSWLHLCTGIRVLYKQPLLLLLGIGSAKHPLCIICHLCQGLCQCPVRGLQGDLGRPHGPLAPVGHQTPHPGGEGY